MYPIVLSIQNFKKGDNLNTKRSWQLPVKKEKKIRDKAQERFSFLFFSHLTNFFQDLYLRHVSWTVLLMLLTCLVVIEKMAKEGTDKFRDAH